MDDKQSAPRGPAYRVVTPRLVLRCWQPADAALLSAAIEANLEHLGPWMPWIKHEPQSFEQRVEQLRRFRGEFDLGQDFTYGIFNRDETAALGGTGLHTRVGPHGREIGYWIHKDHLNRGLAGETASALTHVAFAIAQMKRVEIHCDPLNLRSLAVPRRLGFHHDGTRRQDVNGADGQPRDTMIWSMLAEEFAGSQAAATPIDAFDALGRPL